MFILGYIQIHLAVALSYPIKNLWNVLTIEKYEISGVKLSVPILFKSYGSADIVVINI